jgi:carbohydrate-binding DOMON domain-containing protein
MAKQWRWAGALLVAGLLLATAAQGEKVVFSDPTGDDYGPGTYTYPTDAVYKPGSFDLKEFVMETKGDKATFEVTVNSTLEDPWRMGVGFSVQMVFIFIDTDGKEGSGFTEVPPGLNFVFAPEDAWDRCIILSPQPYARVKQEVEAKAGDMASAILIPTRVKGARQTISGSVDLAALGEGDPATWGYQVIMQSNEGFPAGNDLLTRKVNEYEGQHRFGGGTDYDCDPHVMDILGDHAWLKYECNEDGSTKVPATLHMVHMEHE